MYRKPDIVTPIKVKQILPSTTLLDAWRVMMKYQIVALSPVVGQLGEHKEVFSEGNAHRGSVQSVQSTTACTAGS